MGMFDWYEDAQLKVGPRGMHAYHVGDAVPIKDGVYLAWEGVVVVHGGELLAVHPRLTLKWGEEIDPDKLIELLDDQRFAQAPAPARPGRGAAEGEG